MDNGNKIDNENKIETENLTENQTETKKETSLAKQMFSTSLESKSDVLLFLQEELANLRRKKEVVVYNLDKEYEKTKSNKNLSVWLTLAATVIVVFLVSFFTIKAVSKSSYEVDVTLETFEDLNLRNLFDAMSKTQDLYEKATKQKAELQAGLDLKLSQARKTRDSDLEYIKRLGLSRKNRQDRENRVYANYRNATRAAHEEFDEKIKAAEIEVAQYEQQLKSFDSENVAKAQKYEQQMDSERQVHEIEKNRITTEYETQVANLKTQMQEAQEKSYKEKRAAIAEVTNHYENRIAKLDPRVKDANIVNAIDAVSATTNVDVFDPQVIITTSGLKDEEFISELDQIKKRYEDFVLLNKYARNIPFSNGMTNVLEAEQKITYEALNELSINCANSIETYRTKNRQLEIQNENLQSEITNVKSALGNNNLLLDAYAEAERVDGFVLANSGSNPVLFFKTKSRAEVKNDGSTKVNVYTTANKKVGSGVVWFKQDMYYLSPDQADIVIEPGYYLKFAKK